MRIVFLVANIDIQTGGMERQALQLACALKDNGHRIFFISPVYLDVLIRQKLALTGWKDGIRIFRIPLIKGCGLLNACMYAAAAIPLLVLLRGRYDIIHAHQVYTSGAVACAAVRLLGNNKTVVIKNGAGNASGDIAVLKKMPLGKFLVRLINAARATIVCVNEETRRESEAAGFRRLTTVPNGIHESSFSFATTNEKKLLQRRLLGFQPSGSVILFVGRLGPEKNVSTLIRAMTVVRSDCILCIVGDGILRKRLFDLAAAWGIKDKVYFAGESGEVAAWYRAADLFVLPSLSEGMPNVVLEAMASSLPVIASAIPSIAEIIADGRTGLLFPAGDAEKLAEQIDRVCADSIYARELGSSARRLIEERFDFSIIVRRYEQEYQHG